MDCLSGEELEKYNRQRTVFVTVKATLCQLDDMKTKLSIHVEGQASSVTAPTSLGTFTEISSPIISKNLKEDSKRALLMSNRYAIAFSAFLHRKEIQEILPTEGNYELASVALKYLKQYGKGRDLFPKEDRKILERN